MVSDETFFAWLDGELEAGEAARVAAEVEANPALASRARQHRAMQRRLRSAFNAVADSPVSEGLVRSVQSAPKVIDFGSASRVRSTPRWPLPQWAALAATLAIGVFVGTMAPQRGDAPVATQAGKLYAAASLDRALDTELASAPAGDVRIGLTFRDGSGAICRSFSEAAASGLACRDGEKWRIRGLFAAPEGQAKTYRMAAGMDPNLAALVGSTMTGEPFDAAAERAARQRNWR